MAQDISKSPQSNFDAIRRSEGESDEFWLARDLASILDYQDWRNFVQVIDKARLACVQSGHREADHFGDVTKMVDLGSGAQRRVADIRATPAYR